MTSGDKQHLPLVAEVRYESVQSSTLSPVHNYHVLGLCLGGSARLSAGSTDFQATARLKAEGRGEAYEVSPGSLYLLPAGTPHRLLQAERFHLLALCFCPVCAFQDGLEPLLLPFARVRSGAAALTQLSPDAQERLTMAVRLFEHELKAPLTAPLDRMAQRAALILVLSELNRLTRLVEIRVNPPLVSEALSFIEQHCLEPISLRDVAAALQRNPAYVTTEVRKVTGRTVQDWITTGRLTEACRLLVQTDEYIDVIAERVGYSDHTYFSRLFSRELHMTPAAWRRMHQKIGGQKVEEAPGDGSEHDSPASTVPVQQHSPLCPGPEGHSTGSDAFVKVS